MKLWAAALGLGLILSLFSIAPALAHTQANDGKISGLLHIDPNDIARAGQTNVIHIYFNDQDDRFTMEGCDCKIKITAGKKSLLNGPLGASDIVTGIAEVFLLQNNFSYDVVVSGTPKTAGFFQSFKLVYDVDVGNPPANKTQNEDGPNLLVRLIEGSIVIAGIVGYLAWRKRIKMKQ